MSVLRAQIYVTVMPHVWILKVDTTVCVTVASLVAETAALVRLIVEVWHTLYYNFCTFQTSMNVRWDLTCVPLMLLVPTLREGTTAHVTLDTMEMDFLAIVSYHNKTYVY